MTSCTAMSTIRPVFLTQEEAVALLEICLYSQSGDDPVKAEAMRKLGDLCREFFRGGSLDTLPSDRDDSIDRVPAVEQVDRNIERIPIYA